jgi:hypothetical protein
MVDKERRVHIDMAFLYPVDENPAELSARINSELLKNPRKGSLELLR